MPDRMPGSVGRSLADIRHNHILLAVPEFHTEMNPEAVYDFNFQEQMIVGNKDGRGSLHLCEECCSITLGSGQMRAEGPDTRRQRLSLADPIEPLKSFY